MRSTRTETPACATSDLYYECLSTASSRSLTRTEAAACAVSDLGHDPSRRRSALDSDGSCCLCNFGPGLPLPKYRLQMEAGSALDSHLSFAYHGGVYHGGVVQHNTVVFYHATTALLLPMPPSSWRPKMMVASTDHVY